MKVIYYYYYLFYKNILGESEPKSVAIFVVSFNESFLVNSFIGTILAYYYCIELSKFVMLGIFGITLILNFFIFFSSKKTAEIIKRQPEIIWESHFIYYNDLVVFFNFRCLIILVGTVFKRYFIKLQLMDFILYA